MLFTWCKCRNCGESGRFAVVCCVFGVWRVPVTCAVRVRCEDGGYWEKLVFQRSSSKPNYYQKKGRFYARNGVEFGGIVKSAKNVLSGFGVWRSSPDRRGMVGANILLRNKIGGEGL